MSYKEVELYGRKIRVYSENHIEMEMRGKVGEWQVKPFTLIKGYKYITFFVNKKRIQIKLHRLVFYAHNPSWNILDTSRDNVIDHKNGTPSDNRIQNLQCVTQHENQLNNTKAKGYHFNKYRNKWEASISINRKQIYLGLFVKEEDARNAYLAAKLKYHIIEERVF